ncbi:MAG: hypothetical protein AAGG45_00940 [Pseudomonadota bacterium]
MSTPVDVVPIMLDLDDCGLGEGFDDLIEETEEIELSLVQRLLKSRFVWLVAIGTLGISAFGGMSALGVLPQIAMPTLNNSTATGEDNLTATLGAMSPEQLANEFPEYANLPQFEVAEGGESYLMEYDPNEEEKEEEETEELEEKPREKLSSFAAIETLGDQTEFYIKPIKLQIADGDAFKTLQISLGIKTTNDTARSMLVESDMVKAQLFDTVSELDLATDPKFSLPGTISKKMRSRLNAAMPESAIDGIYVREFAVL